MTSLELPAWPMNAGVLLVVVGTLLMVSGAIGLLLRKKPNEADTVPDEPAQPPRRSEAGQG
jgi:hypothetical protein